MRAPTSEECSSNARVDLDGKPLVAAWYPQMGGYVGKCWLSLRGPGDCFVAYVFHDGDFPFEDGRPPRALHHCSADQFIEFGELVERLSKHAEVDE